MSYRLYRHFNASGELLYVGISLNSVARLAQHRDRSAWFGEIVRIEIEAFETKEAAIQAEIIAIWKERPKYNIRHQYAAPTVSIAPSTFTDIAEVLGVSEVILSKMIHNGGGSRLARPLRRTEKSAASAEAG
jgi:predicted GIY-YIG superfamily endonuclease